MLLAEELLLVALDPVRGRPVNGSREPLKVCLSGALVAELGLRGLALLALAGPARLLEVVADKPHAHARRRIAGAAGNTPVSGTVKKVIAEAAAAATAGAVVAASAGSYS